MRSDPDRILNQLVVTALTVFVLIILLLIALVFRQIRVQQQIIELSRDLQVHLETLEEATNEFQSGLSEVQISGQEDLPDDVADQLSNLTNLLSDVDEQIGYLKEGIEEAALMTDGATDLPAEAVSAPQPLAAAGKRPIDQLFTIFATLVGLAGILIAVLLGMALRIYQGGQ